MKASVRGSVKENSAKAFCVKTVFTLFLACILAFYGVPAVGLAYAQEENASEAQSTEQLIEAAVTAETEFAGDAGSVEEAASDANAEEPSVEEDQTDDPAVDEPAADSADPAESDMDAEADPAMQDGEPQADEEAVADDGQEADEGSEAGAEPSEKAKAKSAGAKGLDDLSVKASAADEQTYTITWLDEDRSTVLDTAEVPAGEMPEYGGETPVKEEDANYTYSFAGWSPTVIAAAGDRSYYATYSATPKEPEVDPSLGDKLQVNITWIIYNTYGIPSTRTQTLSSGQTKNVNSSGFYSVVGGKNRTAGYYGVNYKFLNVFVPATGGPVIWESADDGVTISTIQNMGGGKTKVTFSDGTSQVMDTQSYSVSPVYSASQEYYLDYYYVDNISTGTGSWSNLDAVSSYTHTFKEPAPQPHYQFVSWKEEGTGNEYQDGDSYTYPTASLPSGSHSVVRTNAQWQPSVIVNYYGWDGNGAYPDNQVLLNTVESFEDIAIDDYTPSADQLPEGVTFLGWYEDPAVDAAAADDAKSTRPEITVDPVEQKVYNVYAHYATSYKVQHSLQNVDDDGYTLEEEEIISEVPLGSLAEATPKTYAGFTFNEEVEGTLVSHLVDSVNLVLKLFYDRNVHTVTYEYEGFVPDDASELPAAADYKYEAPVTVADDATAAGYTFSGWSTEDFTMPDEDVVITGSFTANDDTVYTVEHYLQNLDDDGYTLAESVQLAGTTDTTATAEPNTYEGFTFNPEAEGTVQSGNIAGDGSLVLKLYYDRNVYTVTYAYEGFVPEDASELPAAVSYRFGAPVTVADDATASGYTFSGWSAEDFTMPNEDVVITGSFTEVPQPEPQPEPEPSPKPAPKPASGDKDAKSYKGGLTPKTADGAPLLPLCGLAALAAVGAFASTRRLRTE